MLALWIPASYLFTNLSLFIILFLSCIFNLSFYTSSFSSAFKHTKSFFQLGKHTEWLCWMRMECWAVQAVCCAPRRVPSPLGAVSPLADCFCMEHSATYFQFRDLPSVSGPRALPWWLSTLASLERSLIPHIWSVAPLPSLSSYWMGRTDGNKSCGQSIIYSTWMFPWTWVFKTCWFQKSPILQFTGEGSVCLVHFKWGTLECVFNV